MSILKDPILLSNFQNPEIVRKIAQHHRVLIDASETIVKALKSAKNLTEPPAPAPPHIDDLSDSSSSSSGSENSPQASGSNMRRITAEYFRQSLAAAQGRNSLNSISQRNLSQAGNTSNPISPSTSSGSVPTSQRPFISSSMFMNAMNEVSVKDLIRWIPTNFAKLIAFRFSLLIAEQRTAHLKVKILSLPRLKLNQLLKQIFLKKRSAWRKTEALKTLATSK